MPGFDTKSLNDLYKIVTDSLVLKQLHNDILTEDNFKGIFSDIKEEIGYKIVEYEFKCNCNRESMIGYLKKLDLNQLLSMKNDDQIIACSHCSEKYVITAKEIDPLIS